MADPADRRFEVLTVLIPKEEGGTRPDGPVDAEHPLWYPLKLRQDQEGRQLYIVSFDAKTLPPYNPSDYIPRNEYIHLSRNLGRFRQDQEDQMLEAMNATTQFSGTRYVIAGNPRLRNDKDPAVRHAADVKPDEADAVFFRSPLLNANQAQAGGMEKKDGQRFVIIGWDTLDKAIYGHELSHAFAALSHPNGDSKSPTHPRSITAMVDSGHADYPVEIGPLEGRAWQHILGSARHGKVHKTTVDFSDLISNPLLYRVGNVTAGLSDPQMEHGNVRIDMTNEDGVQISGYIKRDGKGMRFLNTALATGTKLQDVIVDPKLKARLRIRGNGDNNRLHGGGEWDILLAVGGNDRLRGGGGPDMFLFDRNSGTGNIIEDFSRSENDRIQFEATNLQEIKLRWRKDMTLDGQTVKGTEVTAVDAAGKTITSTFVLGQPPGALLDRISAVTAPDWDTWIKDESVRPITVASNVSEPAPGLSGAPAVPQKKNNPKLP